MLTLVYPLLEQQLMLAKNVQLIDALQVGTRPLVVQGSQHGPL